MKKWLPLSILIIVVLGVTGLYLNNRVPNLGVLEGQLKVLPSSPNAVSSQTNDLERYVTPFKLEENSYELIMTIISSLDDTEIISKSPNYIHVVFSTNIGFKDDVEFYFDDENGEIHFRSASRLGYSDMGMNKKRYNLIKEMYVQLRNE